MGLELGRMAGDSDVDRYTIAMLHGYLDKIPFIETLSLFLSTDVAYAHYDNDINDRSFSFFASVGGGVRLASGKVKLKLSGDYSSDPYFDSSYRLMAGLDYTFDK